MLTKPNLIDSGLVDSGLSAKGLSYESSVADNLVIYYPFSTDLSDQEGSAGGSTSRTTSGSYVSGTTNLLTTATANNPRFEAEGLLCEGEATNYLLYTEALDNAAWNGNTNIEDPVQDGTLGPDNTASAWKIEVSTTNTAFLAQTVGSDPANSASIWLKKGSVDTALVWFTDFTLGALRATSSDLTLTDEWTEVKLSGSAAGGAIAVFPNHFGETPNAGDTIYVAFPNMQDTLFPTSYIAEVNGGADTRTQETTTVPDDSLPAQNAAQTVCFTFTMLGDSGSNQQLWRVLGETNPRKAVVNTSEQLLLYFGSNFVNSAASTVTPNVIHKAVMRTDGTTTFEGILDGTSMGTAAVTGLSGATNDIAFNVGAAYFLIKEVKWFNAELTDAQLAEEGYA